MTKFLPRKRRQLERWFYQTKDQLDAHWKGLRDPLPVDTWDGLCQRMVDIPEGNLSDWKPRAGSSSAELAFLLRSRPLAERQLLAGLLGASAAGPLTLVEAVEQLELEWKQKLNPLNNHRQYAAQLESLVALLGLTPAARSAYLENEKKVLAGVDQRLFEGLPVPQRSHMANQYQAGSGAYLVWWYDRVQARVGAVEAPESECGSGQWPDIPPAWFALAWICYVR